MKLNENHIYQTHFLLGLLIWLFLCHFPHSWNQNQLGYDSPRSSEKWALSCCLNQ